MTRAPTGAAAMRYIDIRTALPATQRLVSLDALRGFNFVWILGGDGAVVAVADIMRAHGGHHLAALGQFLRDQMTHPYWVGLRFYDLIFPLFILITGVAITLSLPGLVAREGRARAHARVIRRALILYVLGLIYYGGLRDSFDEIRYVGVLQRIAFCYLAASILFLNINWRGLLAVTIALIAGYWALMTFVPVPGIGAGSYAPDANLANWIDTQILPGRMWDKTRDPEGLLSTLPAIATCLIGVLAGVLLQAKQFTPSQKSLWLVGGGVVMTAAGYLWSLEMPLIKPIWTSSFVLATGGMSLVLLGAFHQVIDVWGYKRWTPPFVWIGANAITLYVLNALMGFDEPARRIAGGEFGELLDEVFVHGVGALIVNLTALGLVIVLAGYLYRRKIFLRV
jgi:predicted acyltransferase